MVIVKAIKPITRRAPANTIRRELLLLSVFVSVISILGSLANALRRPPSSSITGIDFEYLK